MKKILFILSALLINLNLNAQSHSRSLFGDKHFNQINIRDLFDKKLLKANGIDLIQIEESFYLVDLIKPKFIFGKITVIENQNIFKWTNKEKFQYFQELGGINKSEMDRIISRPPQAFGRGFYISLHPFDSKSYGDSLVIFNGNKPIIVIEEAINLKNYEILNFTDAEISIIKKLQNIGINAVKCFNNWFSFISNDHLELAKSGSVNNKFLTSDEYLQDQLLFLSNLKDSKVDTLINSDTLWKKIIQKKLSSEDKKILLTYIEKPIVDYDGSHASNEPIKSRLQLPIYLNSWNLIQEALNSK